MCISYESSKLIQQSLQSARERFKSCARSKLDSRKTDHKLGHAVVHDPDTALARDCILPDQILLASAENRAPLIKAVSRNQAPTLQRKRRRRRQGEG
jgi:hypothetical protein